jgi:hypothetical protein
MMDMANSGLNALYYSHEVSNHQFSRKYQQLRCRTNLTMLTPTELSNLLIGPHSEKRRILQCFLQLTTSRSLAAALSLS